LEVAGLVRDSAHGVEHAAAAIDDGSATRVIEALATTRQP
jgi:anthranilate phosphoribosyltransferase